MVVEGISGLSRKINGRENILLFDSVENYAKKYLTVLILATISEIVKTQPPVLTVSVIC